jgi:hypothetical protein
MLHRDMAVWYVKSKELEIHFFSMVDNSLCEVVSVSDGNHFSF